MSRGWTLEAGASPQEGARSNAREHDDGKRVAAAPDAGMLSVAIELADQALRGVSLTRGAYAGLLSDLYEGVRTRMPYRELMDFARATALRAAREPESAETGGARPIAAEQAGHRATC